MGWFLWKQKLQTTQEVENFNRPVTGKNGKLDLYHLQKSFKLF